MQHASRIQPRLPVQAVKTYQVLTPVHTHFRAATCAEVDCPQHLHGWQTPIDESTELGQQQAWYIRNQSGRRYTENRDLLPGVTVFAFQAGQRCFAQHKARLDRPELFLVRDGDWRGNPTGNKRQHTRPEDWVEDFATNQQQLADQLEKG